MSLTRKMLRAMGIEDEKIDQIIEAHGETVDALKADRDKYKADSEKLDDVQKELDSLKAKGEDGYKAKYDELNTEFTQYKADQAAKETKTAKENAYRSILKAAGVPDAAIGLALKASNLDKIELDESGNIKDAKKCTDDAKAEFKSIIPEIATNGASVATPPEGGKETVTKEDFAKMSYNQRVKLYESDPDKYKELTE